MILIFTMLNAGAGILGVLAIWRTVVYCCNWSYCTSGVIFFWNIQNGTKAVLRTAGWLYSTITVMGKLFDRNGGLRVLGMRFQSRVFYISTCCNVGRFCYFPGKLALISSLITLAGGIFIILCNYELLSYIKAIRQHQH